MSRVGIYIRRANRVEGSLLQLETDELKKYILKDHNTLVQTYIDNGYSGMSINRPALNLLMDDCKSGKLDEVVVLCFERLSRNTYDLHKLCNQFKDYGVLLKVKASK